MTQIPLNPDDFTNKIMYMCFEGGTLYTAERDGKFYVITDDCMMAESLSAEDAKHFANYLRPHGRVFDSAQERHTYLVERYGPSDNSLTYDSESITNSTTVRNEYEIT